MKLSKKNSSKKAAAPAKKKALPTPATKRAKIQLPPVPKTLGACADELYRVRQERAQLERQAAALQQREGQLRNHLIEKLPKSDAAGIAGHVARATVYSDPVPVLEDEKKFYAHLRKTGDFSLLQKRLATAAIEERWAAKQVVPGIGRFNAVKVSVEKLK